MDKKHSSLDFSEVLLWYRDRVDSLKDEAMLLERKRKHAVRARSLHQARIKKERKTKRKAILGKKHHMVRRSHVQSVIDSDGVPEHVSSAIRYHLSSVHGVSKCKTCGQVKETKYFSYCSAKYGQNRSVSPACIRCTAMSGYDKDPVVWFCRYSVSEARQRAESSGIPFDIDADWVTERYKSLGGCCELCKRHMSVFKKDYREKKEAGKISFMNYPMNLSLDQRVPGKGYTRDNVQLVNLQCNLAKLDLSQENFLEMCRHVVATHGAHGISP